MKFFNNRKTNALAQDIAVPPTTESNDPSIPPAEKLPPQNLTDDDGISIEAPSENVQQGVKTAEAITLTWTRNELIVAYNL
jgi:hypothetical protein